MTVVVRPEAGDSCEAVRWRPEKVGGGTGGRGRREEKKG